MLYQLSYQAPWEQGGGEEGIQVLVLGAHYITFLGKRSWDLETSATVNDLNDKFCACITRELFGQFLWNERQTDHQQMFFLVN